MRVTVFVPCLGGSPDGPPTVKLVELTKAAILKEAKTFGGVGEGGYAKAALSEIDTDSFLVTFGREKTAKTEKYGTSGRRVVHEDQGDLEVWVYLTDAK